MKISVITTVFNEEDKIVSTIDSVLNQHYPNLEYIIIDAGSKDQTVSNASQYINLLIYSEVDRGIYDGMNKGLSKATGDVIILLNAGDSLVPGSLEYIASEFSHGFNGILANSVAKFTGSPNKFKVLFRSDYPLSVGRAGIQHPAIFVHRDVYQRIGHFNLKYQISADYDFICRALQNGVKIKKSDFISTLVDSEGFSTDVSRLLPKRIEHVKILWSTNLKLRDKIRMSIGIMAHTSKNIIYMTFASAANRTAKGYDYRFDQVRTENDKIFKL